MQQPWLIQRLEIQRRGPERHWEVGYDYMGSAEYEFGAPRDSLKRIFIDEICEYMLAVTYEDQEVVVFMLAKFGFDFAAYQPYLQQLVDNALRLKEPAYFRERVMVLAGKPPGPFDYARATNGWFDIDNDVLWTLTREYNDVLLARLKELKAEWAKRAQTSTPAPVSKNKRLKLKRKLKRKKK
jgi:hypothetical protein